jgi:hypothetical protein
MVVNDNAGSLTPRGVITTIASKLAPTGFRVEINACAESHYQSNNRRRTS